MTLLSIQRGPSTDTNCLGQNASAERVALAMPFCGAREVQVTTLGRQIQELLWESGRPTGAYELIESLKLRISGPVELSTAYRALEFLMSKGFVSKIGSHDAYVPCAHRERHQECLFFFCGDRGATTELADPRFEQLLGETVAHPVCRVKRRVVAAEFTAEFARQYRCIPDGWTNATDRLRPLLKRTQYRMPRLESETSE